MLLLRCFSCLVRGCLGILLLLFFPSFLPHFTWQGSTCHLKEITGSFSLSFSLCVPLNALLPASPGVHQATVRGGAETVRDLAAAATAWTSSTSGNGKAEGQPPALRSSCVCVCVCPYLCPPHMPAHKGGILQASWTSKVLWKPNALPDLVGHLNTLETLVMHSLVTQSLCETLAGIQAYDKFRLSFRDPLCLLQSNF